MTERRNPSQFPFDRKSWANIAWITLVIELVCVVLRFGFGKDSTTATASTIGRMTFGIRIHHGYIGLVMLALALLIVDRWPRLGRWTFVIGMALFLSDAIHHLLVLWPITGSPDFDLVYP